VHLLPGIYQTGTPSGGASAPILTASAGNVTIIHIYQVIPNHGCIMAVLGPKSSQSLVKPRLTNFDEALLVSKSLLNCLDVSLHVIPFSIHLKMESSFIYMLYSSNQLLGYSNLEF
jgi:hypothetical protein